MLRFLALDRRLGNDDGDERHPSGRSGPVAGTVLGGDGAQEPADVGAVLPTRSAGIGRAQEPAADGGAAGLVRARPAAALHR